MGDLTLTNLAEDIYSAADTVGREAVGFIPSVTMNASSKEASVGDTVKAAVTAEAPAFVDIADGLMSVPEGSNQSVIADTFQLTNAKAVQIPMGAEKELQLRNSGSYETVYGDLIQQAMRKLTNQMESDLFVEIKNNASRALGTVGTDPFAFTATTTGLEQAAKMRRLLVDNGMPDDDYSLVLNTIAGGTFRASRTNAFADNAGTADFRQNGTLQKVFGANVRESSQSATHTAGSEDAWAIKQAAHELVGQTTLTVDAGGGGTILNGDIITNASDTQSGYVISSDTQTASGNAEGDIIINGSKGILVKALDNDVVTRVADYESNLMFHRRAAELAMRAPAAPTGGDAATDSIIVQDPASGLVFEVRIYKGYRKSMIEVAAVWGVKAWKSDFIGNIYQ
jgi:hypothetical protein